MMSPEAAAAVITLVGALLAAYWGGRAGGRGAVAAAQAANGGMADQAATDARRAVYAEFAREARGLADAVHQYVMIAAFVRCARWCRLKARGLFGTRPCATHKA